MAPGAISPEPTEPVGSLTTNFDDTLRFFLNGTRVVLDEIDPECTLLEYLRGVGLTGTKLGCGEGGCGACTVVVSQYNPTTRKIYHASVNACLAPLASIDGKHVITIEGIGNTKKPHAAQERVARGNGSQCGFCTPGVVMSLYALLRNNDSPTDHDIEEAFDGNLCRCTGYRSILDAARTFSVTAGANAAASGCAKSKSNGGGGCCMDTKNENGKSGGGCCKDKMESTDDDQPIKRFTPPGFIEYNPDTELIFPPSLKHYNFRPLAFGNKRKKWYRPVTLDQLLEIKSVFPQAKIIGGSSETQIEIKFKALNYPVSVFVGDIPELRQYDFQPDSLTVGGNVTLTDLENLAEEAVGHYGPVQGQVFAAINKQLKYFAGRQIRNVGTPAGNLVTASPISDLNPVLMAAEAVIVAKAKDKSNPSGTGTAEIEIPMSQFFQGYRRTALPSEAVLASIRIPATRAKGEFFRAYKQAKRKDDDIAIVTTAMRVRLSDDNIVEECNLVYGGMAATTVSAKTANQYLIGRQFASQETVEGVMDALEKDFNLSFSVPGGMASYRKALALSLFYRFYHEVMVEIGEAEAGANASKLTDKEATVEIEREISTGETDNETAAAYEKEVLGKANPHVAALRQTTGEAQYTDDIPPSKNELYGCLVLSKKAHARILSIDYDAAFDVAGVVDIIDRKHMPNDAANHWGPPDFDEVFFAEDKVFTVGDRKSVV